jgi:hypothetical protein
MKIKSLLISSLMFPITLVGSLKEAPKLIVPDINKLKLNQEIHLTDNLGIVNIKLVSLLQVGDCVKMYRPDGTLYTGKVTETIEEEGILKIYGTIDNIPDCQFGFAFAKGGIFAGAIVEKKNDKVYALELNEVAKGFIFVFTTKYDKKLI